MTMREQFEAILKPAIDVRTPYAKVMLTQLVEAAQNSARGRTAEIERLKVWVADLQSGMFVNCVYCGHRYGPGETTPVSMADALKAHVAVCPQHPMSALLTSLKEFQQNIIYDEEGDLTKEEFSAMCARADVAIAKVEP